MLETRCQICGRSYTTSAESVATADFTLQYSGVCELCGVTLSRAFSGVVEMLRQSNGERRERVIDRLIKRFEGEGFEVGDLFKNARRSA